MCLRQGLVNNLYLGKDTLTGWKIYSLDIDGAITRGWPHCPQTLSSQRKASAGPAFYMGTLPPNGLALDTFIRFNEWTKVTGNSRKLKNKLCPV